MTGVPEWYADALCTQVGWDNVWFGKKGSSPRLAKETCALCPCRAVCLDRIMELEGGIEPKSRYGVWGGLSPFERYRLMRSGWTPGDVPPPIVLRYRRAEVLGGAA